MSLAIATDRHTTQHSSQHAAPLTRTLKPAQFTPRKREVHYRLDYIALNELTREEELLAYQATTEGLSPAGQHRLDAIEAELDRRWALFG